MERKESLNKRKTTLMRALATRVLKQLSQTKTAGPQQLERQLSDALKTLLGLRNGVHDTDRPRVQMSASSSIRKLMSARRPMRRTSQEKSETSTKSSCSRKHFGQKVIRADEDDVCLRRITPSR